MTRSSADGFANTSYDAALELVDISEEEQELALEVCRRSGIDLGGVDIVRTEEGLKIWEINKVPQLHRFIPATGIEALDIIVGQIKTKYLSD